MKFFLKLGSVLFHPLLIPIIGCGIYFYTTPRFVEPQLLWTQLLSIAIVTITIPLVIYFLLRTIGVVESIYLHDVKERKYPLMIQCILFLLVLKWILNPYDNPELYYFIIGLLITSMTSLILAIVRFKVSLHQAGVAGILFFLVGLSAHFKINLLITISLFLFVNGWIASSRLEAKAHNYTELITGFIIGALPQFILYNLWL